MSEQILNREDESPLFIGEELPSFLQPLCLHDQDPKDDDEELPMIISLNEDPQLTGSFP